MKTYSQYCPIARASEILAERWTPIIVRNLLMGCETYSEIAEGLPGIPKALLSTRLKQLQGTGVVETRPNPTRRGHFYRLTKAGEDLGEVLMALGAWGERWLELEAEHLDPTVVLWSWSRKYVAAEKLPDRRIVVRFEFEDQPRRNRRFWILFDRAETEVCRQPPGFEEDLVVEMDARTLAEWHLGRIEWSTALGGRGVRVTGPRDLARALPTWNRRSVFAAMKQKGAPRRKSNRRKVVSR